MRNSVLKASMNFFLLIIISYAGILQVSESKFYPKVVKSSTYDEIRTSKRSSAEFVLNTQNRKSPSKCALDCNKNASCLSFNFCDVNLCELSYEDIHSTERGEQILNPNDSCIYFGMKKDAIPLCQQMGTFVDIKTDTEKCRNSYKRVNTEWGAWEIVNIIIDTELEWKASMAREALVTEAHGGTTEGNSKKTSWLKIVKTKMPFPKARDNCINMGGALFSDLNGTWDQLGFLLERTDGETHWLGIETKDWEVWKTLDGRVVPGELLVWREGRPNNFGGSQFWVANWENKEGLEDLGHRHQVASVCDMARDTRPKFQLFLRAENQQF